MPAVGDRALHPGIWGGLIVAAAGVAWTLAVGWPSVGERQRQVEALEVLGTIARGAAVYYVKPRGDEGGVRMRCQFPRGQTRTTAAATCCDPSVNLAGTGLCDPERISWNTTLWKVLGVQVATPQPFVFEWQADGELSDARYTASAFADLDCDGEVTTFQFIGRGDPNATPDDCVLRTRPQFVQVGEE